MKEKSCISSIREILYEIEAALGWLKGQAGNDRPDNEPRVMPLHQTNAHITAEGADR